MQATMEPQRNARLTLASLKQPRIMKRQYLRKYSWLPDVLRLKGSVIPHIFGPVVTVTVFSAIVAYSRSRGVRIELANSVIPLLSVVVGLILVFSSSYDRYWEGRKCFSTVTSNVRNLSRMIWVHVALPPVEDAVTGTKTRFPATSQLTQAELRHQKIEVLRYCLAFVCAVKHYLRGEDGVDYGDMAGLLPPYFLSSHSDSGYITNYGNPSYAAMQDSPAASISDRRSVDATKRVKRKRSKQHGGPQANSHTPRATTPLLNDSHQTIEFRTDRISMPVPLIIAHELSSAIFRFKREGLLETVGPAGTNAMSGMRVIASIDILRAEAINRVQSMVDQMTSMERIANTPIPPSYGIHLKQCVTLYLFALPLTLMNELGWEAIPIVTVVAFTLMGIEGIANQIEMPFGYDPQDLPLDTYCDDLKEEVEFLIERLAEGGHGALGTDDGEGDD